MHSLNLTRQSNTPLTVLHSVGQSTAERLESVGIGGIQAVPSGQKKIKSILGPNRGQQIINYAELFLGQAATQTDSVTSAFEALERIANEEGIDPNEIEIIFFDTEFIPNQPPYHIGILHESTLGSGEPLDQRIQALASRFEQIVGNYLTVYKTIHPQIQHQIKEIHSLGSNYLTQINSMQMPSSRITDVSQKLKVLLGQLEKVYGITSNSSHASQDSVNDSHVPYKIDSQSKNGKQRKLSSSTFSFNYFISEIHRTITSIASHNLDKDKVDFQDLDHNYRAPLIEYFEYILVQLEDAYNEDLDPHLHQKHLRKLHRITRQLNLISSIAYEPEKNLQVIYNFIIENIAILYENTKQRHAPLDKNTLETMRATVNRLKLIKMALPILYQTLSPHGIFQNTFAPLLNKLGEKGKKLRVMTFTANSTSDRDIRENLLKFFVFIELITQGFKKFPFLAHYTPADRYVLKRAENQYNIALPDWTMFVDMHPLLKYAIVSPIGYSLNRFMHSLYGKENGFDEKAPNEITYHWQRCKWTLGEDIENVIKIGKYRFVQAMLHYIVLNQLNIADTFALWLIQNDLPVAREEVDPPAPQGKGEEIRLSLRRTRL
ncbi:MAG: hypothetical protein KatS3mg084_0416 [Candidatus Dojkabacteria bacterium]|nr:MAG: hypothetical protein KatS3mg084_0416 [Candidatus Dojkabacteria bacterium]